MINYTARHTPRYVKRAQRQLALAQMSQLQEQSTQPIFEIVEPRAILDMFATKS